MVVHGDDAVEGRMYHGALAGLGLPQFTVGPALLGHVPEDQDAAEHPARRIPDRCGAVVHVSLRAITHNTHSVILQCADAPPPHTH
mgnify:CR=1 FL=1